MKKPALCKRLLANSTLNAEVRNTFTITGLQGSEKVNVIPGSAWAQIDDDERVSVENLRFALEFLYEVLLELN